MRRTGTGVRAYARKALTPAAVAGAAGLVLAPQVALAADAAPGDAPTEVSGVNVDGRKTELEFTAPKFTTPIMDTPRNVTVIPQALIRQTGATSLQDILTVSPGITFGAGEGGQPLADRPFIRGQASGNNVFVDGIRDSGGQIREVFNLEQVEIIKGPDSAFNGRGSGGGSINLSTKRARLETFVEGSAGVGTDAYLRGTVDANYQTGETSAVRLNLLSQSGDFPGRSDVDNQRWGAAVAAAVGLGTPTRFSLSYFHLDADSMPDYGVPLFTKIPQPPASPTVPRTESGVLDVGRDTFYGLHARDYQKTKADIATFIAEHDFNDRVSIRNVFRYGKTLNDYVVTNPGDGGAAQFVAGEWWMKRGTKGRWNPTKTIANVTDIFGEATTGSIHHAFDVGLELSREVNENANYIVYTTSGAPCPAGFTGASNNLGVGDCTRVFDPNPSDPWTGRITKPTPSYNLSKTVGVYAFDTLSFGEKWKLNLGVRFDDYSVSGYDIATTSANGIILSTTPTSRKADWQYANYQAGLVYKPVPAGTLYVSYGTSSTPPTIAGGDQITLGTVGSGNLSSAVLDPEEITSTEVGVKWAFFRNRLSTTAALFHMERQNTLVQIFTGVFAQVGESRVQGLELGVSGRITEAWEVTAGYTWMDSELVRSANTAIAQQGQPLANTPEHSFSAVTSYALTDQLALGGGAYYVSDSFGGNQGGAGGGANKVFAPAYWRFNLYAAYQLNERVGLQLNVNNVTDEEYVRTTNGVHHADFGPGRQAILTLNVRY